jgi:thiamine pyrophosphokinase
MNMSQTGISAVVIADAPAVDITPFLDLLRHADLLIAADGGGRHFAAHAIVPHLAIGDFDSLEPEVVERFAAADVEIVRHPAHKNETDLELALLTAIDRGVQTVYVLAALGGRPDQHLANLQLLTHPALARADVRLLHRGWEVFAIRDRAAINGAPDDLVSLLPMTDEVSGIVTEGLYYPLRDETLRLGPARGVSNRLVDRTAHVSIRSGILLCMHERGVRMWEWGHVKTQTLSHVRRFARSHGRDMAADDGRDLVIVSDFHLSAGYNRRTGAYDRHEDFFYDAAFGRFIDTLLQRAETEPRRWRLIILGDFTDFLQVDPPANGEHGLTSSVTTVAKLEIIARGHAEVFVALARFAAAGHPIELVIGNHDIEFIWPDVQRRFKELVSAHADRDLSALITFHPWLFYVPGVVYAEHGHQYDGVNSFTTLLEPTLPSDRSVIELPLGSFFVLYLFNRIERLDPFADNIRPVTRYLGWALRTHPVRAVGTLGYHVRFFLRVIRKTSHLTAEEQQARREQYRSAYLPGQTREVGLPLGVLDELDRMGAVPANSSRWRQLMVLLLQPLLPSAPVLAAIVALFQSQKRWLPGGRRFVWLVLGIAGLLWRERRVLRPVTNPASYMLLAAQRVHMLLDRYGLAVPAYVFGHTHIAEQSPLADADESPRYFNTGTWTPLVPLTFDLLSTRERFTFVQITRDPANGEVLPQLLLWNDAAGRAEPLPLLML